MRIQSSVPFPYPILAGLLLLRSSICIANEDIEIVPSSIWLPGALGSGSMAMTEAWTSAFHILYPETVFTFSSVDSDSIQKSLWGDIDCDEDPIDGICDPEGGEVVTDETLWGMGDTPFDPIVYKTHSDENLQQFPLCAGGVAIVYSNEVTRGFDVPLNLTFDVIAGIFNDSISSWDDPLLVEINPAISMPNQPITVVVRSDSSGQTSILTEALGSNVPSWPKEAVGQKPEWPLEDIAPFETLTELYNSTAEIPETFGAEKISGVSLGVIRVPFSVTYMEFDHAKSLEDFISPAKIGGMKLGGAFASPTIEGINATLNGLADALDPDSLQLTLSAAETPAGGYPLAGFNYMYLKKTHTAYSSCYQAWLMCKFVEWIFTDPLAREIANDEGYVVPQGAMADVILNQLDGVMCFDDDPLSPGIVPARLFTPPPYRTIESIDVRLAGTVLVSFFIIFMISLVHWLERKRRRGDHIWRVNRKELRFAEPPVVIGRGSFGLVLLGEYRGTKVAVKRALAPEKPSLHRRGSVSGKNSNSFFDRDDASNQSGNTGLASSTHSDKEKNFQEHGLSASDRTGTSSGSYQGSGGSIVQNRQRKNFALNRMGFLEMLHSSKGMRSSLKTMSRQDFMEEMRVLSKLRHPCITSLMGAIINATEEPMLVMEYMEHGSLYDILHNDTMVIDSDIIVPILQDVAQGLRYLHLGNPQIVHGDLKARNVLVDRKFRAKIADFGLSQRKKGVTCGTPYFMAPELLKGRTMSTAASDTYAFGILLYESYSRKDPYEGEKVNVVLREVGDSEIQKRPPVPSNMPADVQTLMKDCLEHVPSRRPSADELDSRLRRLDDHHNDLAHKPLKMKNSNLSLFDIFPRHIAEALRDGRTVQPEHKDCITIFFSDIIGFTKLSSTMDPSKVAALLDRLYNIFDDLTHKYDIYKVETVGDAYMACTNLIKDQSQDHAKRIAMFAIEAIEGANKTPIDPDNMDLGYVNLRVGFHSGPVVANVIGNKNPRYCLFGDTVSTASRMESSSAKNRIQCSQQSAELLKHQMPTLPLCSRGRVEIKGKGAMTTYWVNEVEKRKSKSAEFNDASSKGLNDSSTELSLGDKPKKKNIVQKLMPSKGRKSKTDHFLTSNRSALLDWLSKNGHESSSAEPDDFV